MQILEILVEGRKNPLGLDEKDLMLQWKVKGGGSLYQRAFSIQISEKEDFSESDIDTGWIFSRDPRWRLQLTEFRKPRTRYYIHLSLQDENGLTVQSKGKAWFETGLLGEDLGARWIEPRQEDAWEEPECRHIGEVFMPGKKIPVEERLRPPLKLKRTFLVKGRVKSARLYASARGIYMARLNGNLVDERYFAPEITDYRRRFFYQTYDITEQLKEGSNKLEAVLADGWYVGRIGLSGDNCQYGKRLAFWCLLEMVYEDGRRELVRSDREFLCGRGKYQYADLFMGEMHDDRMDGLYDIGEVRELPEDNIPLIGQKRPPVRVLERRFPGEILVTPKGEQVLDFGEVIAGIVEMKAAGTSGTRITLEFCEQLDQDGNYIDHIAGRNHDQTDVFILGEKSPAWFRPQFTYHGFRYVKVTGYPGKLKKENFVACILGTELERTLHFQCSNKELNQLQKNIFNSQRGNMISLPTDCPQREKSGFTGDIQVYGTTGCYNMNLEHFLEDYLREVRDAQEENGEVPNIAPNFPKMRRLQQNTSGCQSSAGWGDACVLLPWVLYQMYGNQRVLEENYPMMKRWLAFIETEAPDGVWRNDTHFGDWLIPSLTKQGMNIETDQKELRYIVATCYYAKSVQLCAQIAEILEKMDEAETWKKLEKSIKGGFRRAFFRNGRLLADFQGMYVLALAMEMTEGEEEVLLAERLNTLVLENDCRLDTGFMSVRYLLRVLKQSGYRDTARRLLYQEKCPSWLYQVKSGATSIWEKWDARMPDGTVNQVSFNHYSFGCVGEFLYEEIAGIRPAAPGFCKVVIAPDFGFGLDELRLSYELPGGTLGIFWTKQEDGYKVRLDVPFNVQAQVQLPGKAVRELSAGVYVFTGI